MPQNSLGSNVAVSGGVNKPLNLDGDGNLLVAQASGEAPTSTQPAGGTAANRATGTAGVQIKTGAGVFQSFIVNTAGTATTAALYDGTSTSGTKLATIDTTVVGSKTYNIAFTTGLFLVASTSTPADITVVYS